MASDVPTMLPTMTLSPSARALCFYRERLGQPAGLVELDVHRVVARGDRLERGAVVHRLVGANRNGVVDVLQDLVLGSRQRLLDQFDAGLGRGLEQMLQRLRPPGLVRIGDQPRAWRGLAHGGEAHRIAVAPELELEQGIGACFARALPPSLRAFQAKPSEP